MSQFPIDPQTQQAPPPALMPTPYRPGPGSQRSSATYRNDDTRPAYGRTNSAAPSQVSNFANTPASADKVDKDEKENKKKNVDIKAAEDSEFVEEVDGVWGKLGEGAPNYKNVGWIVSACFLINLQIGIGVLALPNTLHALGFIPGLILIVFSGYLTTMMDLVISMFKKAHPEVYTVAEVGYILGGWAGREVLGAMYWIFCVLICGGQILAFATAMNSITLHGTCTIVFVAVGAIVGVAIGLYRTLDKISWLTWVGLASLMAALFAAIISVGVQDRPALAPPTGEWDRDFRWVNNPGFLPGMQAASNIVLAFTGGPCFYNVISEMKRPKDFNKSVWLCQTWVTVTYVLIACIMYWFVGQFIDSPALGSAGPLMKRVCYGLVLPGLIIGVTLYAHIPAKYVFVRALRGSRHLTESTKTHWSVWIGCVVGTGILAFIVSLAVPVFNDLLTVISALCGIPLAVTLPAYMWIWETRRTTTPADRGKRWWTLASLNVLIIAVSLFLSVASLVAAIVSLNTAIQSGEAEAFSCADNSGST